MDYFTRQLLLQLTKLQEAYQKQGSAIDAIQKKTNENHEVWSKRCKEFFSTYKKLEGDKAKSDDRHYKVQNSIRYATWIAAVGAILAFGTGCVYAWINYHQWGTAKETLETETRPWLGIEIQQTEPQIVEYKSTGFGFSVELTNFGKSPALTQYYQEFWLVDAGIPQPILFDRYHICDHADSELRRSLQYASTAVLFPDKPAKHPATAILQPSTRVEGPPETLGNATILLGCTAYEGSTGTLYHTRTIYMTAAHLRESDGTKARHFEVTIAERMFYDFK